MPVINMTPHAVNVYDADDNNVLIYPRGESLIRLAEQTTALGALEDGTPLTHTDFGEAVGLPEFKEGMYYIVSPIVKLALPDRADLLVPAGLVRDAEGRIIGCRSLGM
ncbi:MAG: hypothetical protein FWG71_04290 [Synergistaceae bacterium]|nr:hypothetical protein [Synergistaceae bacterium]